MANTISPDEFKETLARYHDALKAHGKTPKDGSTTLEELDKFRYETAPMSFSKVTGRIMELSDVEKLVQWKIHHGAFRPTLPKLVATNTNATVAAATKEAFAAYAKDNKDIATVISKLSLLKGIGPATASLLLAIHDPQNVVFFSDELYSYLTADSKKVEPKYTTKEFETMFAEAQTVMSRLKCTPIELEKVAYVLVNEKAPEVKKAGRPPIPESQKKVKPAYVPSGKPRGRPAMSDAEKKARQSGREAERAKAAKAVTNRTRTGRIVKPTALLINESGAATKKTRAKRANPAAKKAASAQDAKSEKKRGRPAKVVGAEETKVPAKATSAKKAGRPPKAGKAAVLATKKVPSSNAQDTSAPVKKRGRPAKVEAVEEAKTPKKRASSVAAQAVTATPASKKRGRPSTAAEEEETKTPASKKRKSTATPAPASSAKRGGRTPASAAASSVKRSGRKAKA